MPPRPPISAPPSLTEPERAIRGRLGIPAAARHVLILAESSHWDPNWLQTSSEYFERFVRPNLDAALAELLAEPRRVYSVECLFFLRLYWEACPERRETVRSLVNSGRLRLTSSGVTTADTLLPRSEAILRDFLLGQEWLRANGMTPEPRLAYFPDSFGCSHALPSLLNAAGFDRTAITRIDGMYFLGADLPFKKDFVWAGSSAHRLLKEDKSLDFVWRDGSGGEVLCHWNAFTYGQGDMLAYSGYGRIYLFPLAIPNRSAGHVRRRIHGYARRLIANSRTPYLFCPIGLDFVGPIPGLVALLDRYNQETYPHSGIWALNAGLDDYLELVDCHRERLPFVALDPNPYWTGFYTSRPTLKKQCHETVERLLLADALAAQPENTAGAENHAPAAALDPGLAAGLQAAWWQAAVSNHHDFITGTSTDRVRELEQKPWLRQAGLAAAGAIHKLRRVVVGKLRAASPTAAAELPEWQMRGGVLTIQTACYALELAEEAGGAILRAWDPSSGQELLAGLSNDLVSYRDTGGMWRMGHEFRGGSLEETARTSQAPAPLQVRAHDGLLEVTCSTKLEGKPVVRRLWFSTRSPVIQVQVHGRAAARRTVTLLFNTGIAASRLAMDEPGGVVVRPLRRKYDPTFWPLQSFLHVLPGGEGRGLAIFQALPGAAACREVGQVELVVNRTAMRETAYGFIHFPGLPVTGREWVNHTAGFGLLFTPGGDWQANGLPRLARSAMDGAPDGPAYRSQLACLLAQSVSVDHPAVSVTALKPASRGEGVIVRLDAPGLGGTRIRVRLAQPAVAAWLCDARERDLHPLEVQEGGVAVDLKGAITSVRIIPS